jgi:hypothetical protein
MLPQINRRQQQFAEAQVQPTFETVTASSGGGAVKATMTGDQKCRSVEISPELLRDADAEIMQDLILSAVNLALEQSLAPTAARLGPLAGGMPFQAVSRAPVHNRSDEG